MSEISSEEISDQDDNEINTNGNSSESHFSINEDNNDFNDNELSVESNDEELLVIVDCEDSDNAFPNYFENINNEAPINVEEIDNEFINDESSENSDNAFPNYFENINNEPPINVEEIGNEFINDESSEHLTDDDDNDDEYYDAEDDVLNDEEFDLSSDEELPLDSDSSDTSSESSEEGNNMENEEIDPPLYAGAPLSLSESLLSILALVTRFKITGVLLAAILTLIAMHCPEPNFCVESLYYFKKYFENYQTPLTTHYYCEVCFNTLRNQDDQCTRCLELTQKNYFISLSIISQLQAMYSRRGFREKLSYPQNRVKHVENNYEDIYDGTIYKELSQEGGILSNRNNISFTWYTDGVSVFKSSKFSFWPMYLVINELPYKERFRKENLIIVGLWFGEKKPNPNLFLLPSYNEIQQLLNGVAFNTPDAEGPIIVQGIIISGTCDLPAKALFLNMQQYNGTHGCQKCKIRSRKEQGRQIYPYRSNLPLRNEAETLEHAESAELNRKIVKGVKGSSIISRIAFSWIRSTALDSMHCVFMGVLKALMTLWFDPSHAGKRFSISHLTNIVDERLRNILPPEFVQRKPRSILEHLKYWKASELKNFFFYFSLPILKDILHPEYYEHYQYLVAGIYLLCHESISESMIDDSSRLLKEFVSKFRQLYGLEHMTCNLHSLLHFPDEVRTKGPIWVYNCFPFEDINGKLKALVHGSKSAELQIYFGMSLFINTYTLSNERLREGAKAHTFCKKLHGPTKQMKLRKIGNDLYVIGNLSKLRLDPVIQNVIRQNNIYGQQIKIFCKLYKYKTVFSSKIYTRAKKTNSTCVKYSHNGITKIGNIHLFIRVTNCLCKNVCDCPADHYAVIKPTITENGFHLRTFPRIRVNYMHKITRIQDQFEIVNIQNLQCVCFQNTFRNNEDNEVCFVAEPINTVEEE